ncbi:MAG: tetratricopeptide repeat protein [Terriglobia bacterium]|nr:tetratricopeptide repeat protein [Terriglobia bacterium]
MRRCAGVLLLLTCLHAFGQFEDPETTLQRGDTALGQGRFDIAQSIYQGVLAANPNLKISNWRCRNIAEANIRATHPNLKAGADWLQRAVDQNSSDLSSRERLGGVLLQLGEPDRAAAQYDYLLRKNPDSQPYVLGMAAALRDLGQYGEGSRLLSAALQQNPNDPELRVEYARNLLYQRQYAAAKDQYRMVLRWYPDNTDALIGLGKVYSWQGNQQLALEQYQKALVVDPGNYDALVGQGFSLIWSDRKSEALPMLERANSRHPEVAEVRDALKRLGAVNIFTGDVSAGAPEWPILAPTIKRTNDKSRGNTTTAWNPPLPLVDEASESAKKPQASSPAPTNGNSQPGHSNLWVIGMGLAVLVSVFVVAAFFLFFLPTVRNKKEGKTVVAARLAEATPAPNPVEQWARLEEFSRPPRVEKPARSYRPVEPASKMQAEPLPLSELLPAPKPSEPEVETEPQAAPAQAMTAAVEGSAAASAQNVETPRAELPVSQEAEAPRTPRRRRGAAAPERPWWRDLSNPDLAKSIQQDEPESAANPMSQIVPLRPLSPFLDAPDDVVVPSDAPNPLTPASEKPSPPEEPPPSRPFTQVLQRALERAGDGQAEEPPEPIKAHEPEETDIPQLSPNGNGSGRAVRVAHAPEPEIARALNEANIVIVGCGVMVSHYRTVLKAAGADVRTFTFWDLAMSSMRKRRADVLLIDGDALDGLTPVQMYTSAQVEKYMFGSILVGVSSDEDRTALPQDVVLAHSLTDDDLRTRFMESLQAS